MIGIERVYIATRCPRCGRGRSDTLLLDSVSTGTFCLHCLMRIFAAEQERTQERVRLALQTQLPLDD